MQNETEAATPARYDSPKGVVQPAHCVHLRTLIEAFAVGAIQADPWHRNYALLPGFQDVLDRLAVALRMRFGEADIVYLSPEDVEGFYRNFITLTDPARAWNDSVALRRLAGEVVGADEQPQEYGFVSRYDRIPESRDFVDLDALVRNAVLYVTRHVKSSEESDSLFGANHRLRERVSLLERLLLDIDESCRRVGEKAGDTSALAPAARFLRYGAPDETDTTGAAYQSAGLASMLAELRAPKSCDVGSTMAQATAGTQTVEGSAEEHY